MIGPLQIVSRIKSFEIGFNLLAVAFCFLSCINKAFVSLQRPTAVCSNSKFIDGYPPAYYRVTVHWVLIRNGNWTNVLIRLRLAKFEICNFLVFCNCIHSFAAFICKSGVTCCHAAQVQTHHLHWKRNELKNRFHVAKCEVPSELYIYWRKCPLGWRRWMYSNNFVYLLHSGQINWFCLTGNRIFAETLEKY